MNVANLTTVYRDNSKLNLFDARTRLKKEISTFYTFIDFDISHPYSFFVLWCSVIREPQDFRGCGFHLLVGNFKLYHTIRKKFMYVKGEKLPLFGQISQSLGVNMGRGPAWRIARGDCRRWWQGLGEVTHPFAYAPIDWLINWLKSILGRENYYCLHLILVCNKADCNFIKLSHAILIQLKCCIPRNLFYYAKWIKTFP